MAAYIAQNAGILRDDFYSPKQRDEGLERCWGYLRYCPSPFQQHDFTEEFSKQTGLDTTILANAGNLAIEFEHRAAERTRLTQALSDAHTALRNGTDPAHIRAELDDS